MEMEQVAVPGLDDFALGLRHFGALLLDCQPSFRRWDWLGWRNSIGWTLSSVGSERQRARDSVRETACEVLVEQLHHLHHLRIVAEVCRETGVAEWFDAQNPTSRQPVSMGTAMVAMGLNGLGFGTRQLYLMPHFFAGKPVEHLLEPRVRATDLNHDCLGRT